MKILIGALAHQLHSEVVRRLYMQQWDDPDGYDVLTMWGQDIQAWEDRMQAVTRKYQALQRIFLSGPWDVLLTVEQDMLIPPDALLRLSRLLIDGADVAYGLYVWRYTEQRWWNAHLRVRYEDGDLRWASLSHAPDEARRLWGEVVRVEGLGLGCTMLPRPTLARLGFRMRALGHSCDTSLALDCQDQGLIQVCDTGLVCGHMLTEGGVIWPDPTTETLYRIEEA